MQVIPFVQWKSNECRFNWAAMVSSYDEGRSMAHAMNCHNFSKKIEYVLCWNCAKIINQLFDLVDQLVDLLSEEININGLGHIYTMFISILWFIFRWLFFRHHRELQTIQTISMNFHHLLVKNRPSTIRLDLVPWVDSPISRGSKRESLILQTHFVDYKNDCDLESNHLREFLPSMDLLEVNIQRGRKYRSYKA